VTTVPVTAEEIDLPGDSTTIVAVCRRGQHRQTIPLLDLQMPNPVPSGARWIEADRRWKE
jgi:hypothetical protein